MRVVDLTVPIGSDTYSPPSVNQPIEITEHYKEPGFWMVSEIKMMLHAGSHVDFTKHFLREIGPPPPVIRVRSLRSIPAPKPGAPRARRG